MDSVTDDQGRFVLQVNPPYDMDLYPVNALTAPQEAHTVTASGTLPVRATLSVSGLAAGQRTSAVFTVKRRGALVAKQAVEFVGIDPAQPSSAS